MDIALLSKMVGELILDNDQVGLPGIGTFVAELVPASFSDRGYTINPPYRRIVFHPDCLEDQLLCAFYCRANSDVDMPTAKVYLQQYLSELKAVLMEKRSIVLPGLGRLRTTRDSSILFIPDEDLDIFPEGCGLEPVSLKTHSVAAPEIVELNRPRPAKALRPAEPVQPEAAAIPEPVKPEPEAARPATGAAKPEAALKPRRRSRWWIAPTAVILGAAAALGIFVLLAHVAPDFIDTLLYTPEELAIINYPWN